MSENLTHILNERFNFPYNGRPIDDQEINLEELTDKIANEMIEYFLNPDNWKCHKNDVLICKLKIKCKCERIYTYERHLMKCKYICALEMEDTLKQKVNEIFNEQYRFEYDSYYTINTIPRIYLNLYFTNTKCR